MAKFSPWFSSVECQTGIGGDKLIKDVFKNVSKYAEKNCKFYFPIISLSDVTSIKSYAEKYFKNMKIVKKKNWPLPETMLPKIDFLRKLKEEGKVDFKERFGIDSINIPDQKGNYRETLRENDDSLERLKWKPTDRLRDYITSLNKD